MTSRISRKGGVREELEQKKIENESLRRRILQLMRVNNGFGGKIVKANTSAELDRIRGDRLIGVIHSLSQADSSLPLVLPGNLVEGYSEGGLITPFNKEGELAGEYMELLSKFSSLEGGEIHSAVLRDPSLYSRLLYTISNRERARRIFEGRMKQLASDPFFHQLSEELRERKERTEDKEGLRRHPDMSEMNERDFRDYERRLMGELFIISDSLRNGNITPEEFKARLVSSFDTIPRAMLLIGSEDQKLFKQMIQLAFERQIRSEKGVIHFAENTLVVQSFRALLHSLISFVELSDDLNIESAHSLPIVTRQAFEYSYKMQLGKGIPRGLIHKRQELAREVMLGAHKSNIEALMGYHASITHGPQNKVLGSMSALVNRGYIDELEQIVFERLRKSYGNGSQGNIVEGYMLLAIETLKRTQETTSEEDGASENQPNEKQLTEK